jgi:type I restriction enzyme R subunit
MRSAPKEEDLSKGVLEAIDMDSYRVEVRASMAIALPDEDAEVGPVPTSGAPTQLGLEMERLSAIVREFNERFGGIEWNDADKIRQVITEELPAKVAANEAYQNARERSDRQNARIESDRAVQSVINSLLTTHTELFKQFYDNESFRRDVEEMVFKRVSSDSSSGAAGGDVESPTPQP